MDTMQAIRDRAHARVGTVIRQKWQLDGLLGLGGTAAVYAATHRNGAVAAVKVLRAELCGFPDVVQRFVREGYVANKIGHAAVVSVLDDDVTDEGAPFLVMELLEGESLERYTKGTLLPMQVALRVVDTLLDVLVAAHDKGVLHRDIKPANLFLMGDGRVKVLDFGIARLAEGHDGVATETGTTIGTPGYMPPEQARGRWNQVDARTDVWAAGATLYALLTGFRPRRADTAQEELLLAMTAAVAPIRTVLPQLDPAIASVVDTALAFEMNARFPSARAMQDALRAAVAALPANATTGPVAEPDSVDVTIPTGPSGAHGSGPRPSWGNDAVQPVASPATYPGLSQPPISAMTDIAQVVDPGPPRRSRLWVALAGGALAAFTVLGLIIFVNVRHRAPRPPIDSALPPALGAPPPVKGVGQVGVGQGVGQGVASVVPPAPSVPALPGDAPPLASATATSAPSSGRTGKPPAGKVPVRPPPTATADPFDRRF